MSRTVSGVISAYGRPELLREAIESALAQTRPLDELIVVDDHSPHDLSAIVAAYGERVRYLRLPTNRGANAARNAGVAAARGDVVAFLDDDDQWCPPKIEHQLARIAAGYEACLCGWQHLGGSFRSLRAVDEIDEAQLRVGNSFCGTSGLVARRAILHEVPFDEQIRQGDDWDLYIRLARRRPLAYVRLPLLLYRHGDHSSMTQPKRDDTPACLMKRTVILEKHRAWLGERHYRDRLASYLLNAISHRPGKHRFLWQAIRHAGPRASFRYLLRRSLKANRWM